MRKNMVVAGALLGSVLVLSGCRLDVNLGNQKQSAASYDVDADVTALDVNTGSGDIVISESDRSGVRVTETLHWSGEKDEKPVTEHPVDGGTLTLRYECPSRNCAVDYRVEVPKGVKATLESGSGNITLRTLTGEVNATASSGDIEARALGAKQFVANTGAGDVEIRFDVVPDRVEIESGSGDATVRLPKADYKVTADTGSGDRTVKVANDPSSSNIVSVRTGAGNANVLPA